VEQKRIENYSGSRNRDFANVKCNYGVSSFKEARRVGRRMIPTPWREEENKNDTYEGRNPLYWLTEVR